MEKKTPKTKKRDLIIFAAALLVIAYLARDDLIGVIQDKGHLIEFDAEYDNFLIVSDKVHPLLQELQDACNTKEECPAIPDGWTLQSDSIKSARGGIVYTPENTAVKSGGSDPKTFSAFTLTYDYSPDWQLLAHGGVSTKVTLERIKK